VGAGGGGKKDKDTKDCKDAKDGMEEGAGLAHGVVLEYEKSECSDDCHRMTATISGHETPYPLKEP
jgi:hypothetical protein